MSYSQPDGQANSIPTPFVPQAIAERARNFLDQAEQSIHAGHYSQAAQDLLAADREMLTLTRLEREQMLLTARAFYLQGFIYFSRQMLDEAKAEFLLAEQHLAGREDGRQLRVEVLARLGNTYHLAGQVDEATIYYREAGAHATLAGQHLAAVKAYNNIGNICLGQGKVEEAIGYYNLGLDQARLSSDPAALARTYRALAWLHSNYGPYRQAHEYAVLAIRQCELVASQETRGLIQSEAARVFARCGELDRAEYLLSEAYNLLRHSESKMAEAMAAVNVVELWEAHWRRNQQFMPEGDAVIKALEEATISPLLRSEAIRGLANYYVHGHDLARVRHYLTVTREAFGMQGNLSHDDQAIYAHTLARLLTALGEAQEAAQWYQETIRLMTTAQLSRYQLACVWLEYAALLTHPTLGSDLGRAAAAIRQAQLLGEELGLIEPAIVGGYS